MTNFQQALHVFRKDARHLRFEIGGIFLLLLILILSGVQTWEGLQERGGPDHDTEGPLTLLLPLAWSLLIARVIQTEALPGDRHFWLTRPYNRGSLVLSKLMFVAAFINFPFLIAQAAIILLDGLPLLSNLGGLLWNQVMLTILLLLPVAAVAALTRNLAQFLPAVVLTAGMLAGPVGDHHSLGDVEWIRSSLGFLIAAAITAFVLSRQYRLRRSGNTALLAAGATIAGMILYLSVPHSVAFAIQSNLIGSPDKQFALRLSPAEPGAPEMATRNRYRQMIAMPIAVTGADAADLRVESSGITVKTLAGITRRSSDRIELVEQKLVHTTFLERKFFEAAKNSPVTVRSEFYVTQFAAARTAEVPLDGTPVYIAGPGQCGVIASYDRRTFLCRSAFRSPQAFLSERISRESHDSWRDSYSPFPAYPHIYPVEHRTYRLTGSGVNEVAPAVRERPATLVVRDPVAYFRYTMETGNVRLGDYAIDEPRKEDDN
jgi:hypothetical protein